ncbi:carboxypeptidase-like regulatory domain-containing protein [Aquimarina celericrescens]|uniref:Carboxypeptidase-like regulatory domain-containing protein n=1 Tax=Aquimarina celericrescens TaxID=1964542 RepID=A0ABW5AV95_9FLAO|nr:carboxypeptidase-like regulatory domain-containing protein [Aquimarina celericrescens]
MNSTKLTCFSSLVIPLSLIFIHCTSTYGQIKIKGKIYDDFTKKPIAGVVVYLDGTSKGTVSNANGIYMLEVENNTTSSLIISHLGYQTINLTAEMIEAGKHKEIYLKTQLEVLDPVLLENDTWSREKKMKYFKDEFIGKHNQKAKFRIENEDDVSLYYKASENTLYASSWAPLRLKNYFLGYNITYDLKEFRIKFDSSNDKKIIANSVYFVGTSFFSELTQNKKQSKYRKRRKRVYKGSVLHFMRSLATDKLNKNKYEFFSKGTVVPRPKYILIETENKITKVKMNINRIGILYRKQQKSFMVAKTNESYFNIDSYGNYRPHDMLFFGGHMGNLRLGELLPLDYNIE